MKDAIKTLYEHWINVHTTTPAEKSAFEVIYEAFKEGVLTALSLLHPLPEQGDNNI